jgi:hypothetical protein
MKAKRPGSPQAQAQAKNKAPGSTKINFDLRLKVIASNDVFE